MAIDWMLLESVEKTGVPVMRIYRWEPFCISLGYNQALSHINLDKCKRDNIDVVRRPTGGRAVLHAQEVTYSVIVPSTNPYSKESVTEFYMLVSQGLAKGIQTLGVPAVLEKRGLDLHNHYKNSALSASCFSAAARYEVVVNGKKLIGSAQRRIKGGLLQHGSIITGDAHLELPFYLQSKSEQEQREMKKLIAEKTVSVGGYLQKDISYHKVGTAVKQGVAQELSVSFKDDKLTEEEVLRAEELIEKFSVRK